ncbi:MAG: hypothetical protein KJ706_01390, partial [Candidatus Omnitrophica bacterium]|nr:hypothetical protein [Candidatus Omnitrophota bacterium]
RNIYCAFSPEEALEIFKDNKIDLLITDLNLKPGWGITLISEAQKIKKGLPAVLMSLIRPEDFETDITWDREFMKTGAAFVNKRPSDSISLIVKTGLKVLEEQLASRRAERAEKLTRFIKRTLAFAAIFFLATQLCFGIDMVIKSGIGDIGLIGIMPVFMAALAGDKLQPESDVKFIKDKDTVIAESSDRKITLIKDNKFVYKGRDGIIWIRRLLRSELFRKEKDRKDIDWWPKKLSDIGIRTEMDIYKDSPRIYFIPVIRQNAEREKYILARIDFKSGKTEELKGPFIEMVGFFSQSTFEHTGLIDRLFGLFFKKCRSHAKYIIWHKGKYLNRLRKLKKTKYLVYAGTLKINGDFMPVFEIYPDGMSGLNQDKNPRGIKLETPFYLAPFVLGLALLGFAPNLNPAVIGTTGLAAAIVIALTIGLVKSRKAISNVVGQLKQKKLFIFIILLILLSPISCTMFNKTPHFSREPDKTEQTKADTSAINAKEPEKIKTNAETESQKKEISDPSRYVFGPIQSKEWPPLYWKDRMSFFFNAETNLIEGGYRTGWKGFVDEEYLDKILPERKKHSLIYLLPSRLRAEFKGGIFGFNPYQFSYNVLKPSPFIGVNIELGQRLPESWLVYNIDVNPSLVFLNSASYFEPQVNPGFYNVFDKPRHFSTLDLAFSAIVNIGTIVSLGENFVSSFYAGIDNWHVQEPYYDEDGTSIGGNIIYYPSPVHRLRGFFDWRSESLREDFYIQDIKTVPVGYTAGFDWTWMADNAALNIGLLSEERKILSKYMINLGYVDYSGIKFNIMPYIEDYKIVFMPDKKGIGFRALGSIRPNIDVALMFSWDNFAYHGGTIRNDYKASINLGLSFGGAKEKAIPLDVNTTGELHSYRPKFDSSSSEKFNQELKNSKIRQVIEESLYASSTLESFINNLEEKINTTIDLTAAISLLHSSMREYMHWGREPAGIILGVLSGNIEEIYQALRQSYFDKKLRLKSVCAGFAQFLTEIINRISGGEALTMTQSVEAPGGHAIITMLTKDGYVLFDYGQVLFTLTHNLEEALRMYQGMRGGAAINHEITDPEDRGRQIGSIITEEGKLIRRAVTVFGDKEQSVSHIEKFLDAAEERIKANREKKSSSLVSKEATKGKKVENKKAKRSQRPGNIKFEPLLYGIVAPFILGSMLLGAAPNLNPVVIVTAGLAAAIVIALTIGLVKNRNAVSKAVTRLKGKGRSTKEAWLESGYNPEELISKIKEGFNKSKIKDNKGNLYAVWTEETLRGHGLFIGLIDPETKEEIVNPDGSYLGREVEVSRNGI